MEGMESADVLANVVTIKGKPSVTQRGSCNAWRSLYPFLHFLIYEGERLPVQDQITNENTERKSEGLEKYIWS